MAAKKARKQAEEGLDPAVAQMVARHTQRFARDIRLMTDPEFLELNRRGLEEIASGKPGISWEEFQRRHPFPRQ